MQALWKFQLLSNSYSCIFHSGIVSLCTVVQQKEKIALYSMAFLVCVNNRLSFAIKPSISCVLANRNYRWKNALFFLSHSVWDLCILSVEREFSCSFAFLVRFNKFRLNLRTIFRNFECISYKEREKYGTYYCSLIFFRWNFSWNLLAHGKTMKDLRNLTTKHIEVE